MATILATDEQIVNQEKFTSSLIIFWLKTEFTLSNKRIIGKYPRTLFGIIPLGNVEMTLPLKNIASVLSSTKFYFSRLFIGLIFVFVGFAMINSFGIFLLLFGVLSILNCFTSTFVVSSGGATSSAVIELSILEKSKVATFVSNINHRIVDL